MENNHVMIFAVNKPDALRHYGLFTKEELDTMEQTLEDAIKVYAFNYVAVDIEVRQVIATCENIRTPDAEYVNESYFHQKNCAFLDTRESWIYENSIHVCKLNDEILYIKRNLEAKKEPVKVFWGNTQPVGDFVKYHMPPERHIPQYIFNWSQFAHFGTRQSKILMFLLGYDTSSIPDMEEETHTF